MGWEVVTTMGKDNNTRLLYQSVNTCVMSQSLLLVKTCHCRGWWTLGRRSVPLSRGSLVRKPWTPYRSPVLRRGRSRRSCMHSSAKSILWWVASGGSGLSAGTGTAHKADCAHHVYPGFSSSDHLQLSPPLTFLQLRAKLTWQTSYFLTHWESIKQISLFTWI